MIQVLLVESDFHVRAILRMALEGDGYHVLTSPHDGAAQVLSETAIDILVASVTGGIGVTLAEHARARGVACLLIGSDSHAAAQAAGIAAFLAKPFQMHDFLAAISRCLGQDPACPAPDCCRRTGSARRPAQRAYSLCHDRRIAPARDAQARDVQAGDVQDGNPHPSVRRGTGAPERMGKYPAPKQQFMA